MALGEFNLFRIKSKQQRIKEEEEYALWAFPYGESQKEKLSELIKEFLPKISKQIGLASFLTCKELYDKSLESSETDETSGANEESRSDETSGTNEASGTDISSGTHEEAIKKFFVIAKKYNQLVRTNETPIYLALVLADREIDENCEYPPADEIRTHIQELNDIQKAGKKGLF